MFKPLLHRVFMLGRRLPVLRSRIAASLDPTNGPFQESVELSGWAFSPTTAIVSAQATLPGVAPVELTYGVERPDIVAAFGDHAPLHCGFAGGIVVDPERSGPATLRVRIADAKGRQREIITEIDIRPVPMHLHVDAPNAGTANWGDMVIQGWAFSPGHRIVEVHAQFGDRARTALAYGLPRPDVAAAYGNHLIEHCGFDGTLLIDASETPHAKTLVVRATDDIGVVTTTEVAINVNAPLCEIERLAWRGDRLEIEGWFAWPRSVPPRRVRVFLGEASLDCVVQYRPRPEVAGQLPELPAGACRGFVVDTFVNAAIRPAKASVALTVECTDGEGRQFRRAINVEHEPDVGGVSGGRVSEIVRAVGRIHEQVDRELTILSWHDGLSLEVAMPGAVVFSPPTLADSTLPYFDGTIDVVVVPADNPARVADARRVAAVATIENHSDRIDVCERPSAPLLHPTTTIVIPVHNQVRHTDACLMQVMATLPSGFRGEIVVVDDASNDETADVLGGWTASHPIIRVLRNEENVGFLESCNRAAASASGDVLVFLNNDTLPRQDWLPPLLRALREQPEAGAVGGKLLYPDSTLQEAGGVIFSDGTGWNVGRGDPHPNRPLYSFVREVDYCSGALLAIRRAVFAEMGGFDVLFRPAYYEDTDLCFRLRERGYRVYYQPASVVVHVEGATSGTDPVSGDGAKRHQSINQRKFVEKWREALALQPAPSAKVDLGGRGAWSARSSRRRALVCAPRMPEFDRESGSKRTSDTIELLQESGWTITFVALDSMSGDRYARRLQQRGVATYAGPESPLAGDESLEDLDGLVAHGGFSLAVLSFWSVAERMLPRLRSLSSSTRVIVDSVDVHFLREARQALRRQPGGEPPTLPASFADRFRRELNAYAGADAVLTVSQKEADLINGFVGAPALASTVPDMEEIPRSRCDFHERGGLLFVGNFRHAPNLEGLEFLCADILPRLDPALLARHPLLVVGNEVDEHVRTTVRRLKHVKLIGWVPSLGPYLEHARISVVPLLHGAGTKRKLVQALMAGTPSVSTSIGIEGLGLVDGADVLVTDDPREFAARLAALLEDPGMWKRLADSGRATIERTHGRSTVHKALRSVIDNVMSRPSATST